MTDQTNLMTFFVAAFTSISCAHAEGTRPSDMGAAAHQEAADESDAKADEHGAQYDPKATQLDSGCIDYCFWTNPTGEHKALAVRLRKEAARHREASEVLRRAEAEACVGIPEENRALSPFFFRERIQAVDVPKRGPVKVRFEPVRGVSLAQFEALVQCHLARNASIGFPVEGMDYCPLALPGVEADLSLVDDGVEVVLKVKDPEVRTELAGRVEELGAPRP